MYFYQTPTNKRFSFRSQNLSTLKKKKTSNKSWLMTIIKVSHVKVLNTNVPKIAVVLYHFHLETLAPKELTGLLKK